MPHIFIPDPSISVAYGPPLAEENTLGALTLPNFLAEVAARYHSAEALVYYENGARISWSYNELFVQARKVAKALVSGGLAKGERVGIWMTNRPEFLAAAFGVGMAGGVASPISTFSTQDELEYLLSISGISILLMESKVLKKDYAAMLTAIAPEIATCTAGAIGCAALPFLKRVVMTGADTAGAVESWEAFLTTGNGIADEAIDARTASALPSDEGVLFYSSGSTAKPKGILSSHKGVAIQCWRLAIQQGLPQGVRYWTANGFFWSGNFSNAMGAVLAAGGCMLLQSTFQPSEALDLMAREKAQFVFAWPHQWEQLTSAPNWLNSDLSSLKFVDKDGPIAAHPSVFTDWIEPRHAYGNTETFTLSSGYPANSPPETTKSSSGLPFAGNIFKIVDPISGKTMPLGERGEIAVKGPTLMMGYLGTPLSESLDENDFFRTGDGGYLDGEGRLFWEGRLNDIIKTGGANVSPLEIDAVLQELSGVKICQTVGVPHDTLGELVVSCIVPHEGAGLHEDTVRDYAKSKLASYKVPRRIFFFDEAELNMTGSAKVKTADLRAKVQLLLA